MLGTIPRSVLKTELRDRLGHRYCTQPGMGKVPCSHLDESKTTEAPSSEGKPGKKPKNVKVEVQNSETSGKTVDTNKALKALGMSADTAAFASGAPDDSEVIVRGDVANPKRVKVFVKHDWLKNCELTLNRDSEGKLYLKTDLLRASDTAPKGAGSDFFEKQVENAVEANVTYMTAHAAGSWYLAMRNGFNGYYTWPTLGYDQHLDDYDNGNGFPQAKAAFPDAVTVLDILDMPEAKLSLDEEQEVKERCNKLDVKLGRPPRFSDSERKVSGKDWWLAFGEEMLDAKFDLTPGSRSLKVLAKYMADKRSKGVAKSWSITKMAGSDGDGCMEWGPDLLSEVLGIQDNARSKVKGFPRSVLKEGFSGRKVDAAGRAECYENGHHIPCSQAGSQAKPNAPKQYSLPDWLGTPTKEIPQPPQHLEARHMRMAPAQAQRDVANKLISQGTNPQQAAQMGRKVAQHVEAYSTYPPIVYQRVLGKVHQETDDFDHAKKVARAAADRAASMQGMSKLSSKTLKGLAMSYMTKKSFPRSILKGQDVHGKPCPPGYNNKRDGCTEGEGHDQAQGKKPDAKPQARPNQNPHPIAKPLSRTDADKAVAKLRDDKRVFRMVSGELIRASDIRIKDDLSGQLKFVAVLRQNAHDPDSPLVGKFVDVPGKWVSDWANSADVKSQPKPPKPQTDVADNKPHLPGSEAYEKPLDKPVLGDISDPSKKPVSNVLNPPKPQRGPSIGVLPKKKPVHESKPATAKLPNLSKLPPVREDVGGAANKAFNDTQVDRDLLEKALSGEEKLKARNLPLTESSKKYVPAIKRDKEGKPILGANKKPEIKLVSEKDKNGKLTGKKVPGREGQILIDGKPVKLPHKMHSKISGFFRLDMPDGKGGKINWTDLKISTDPDADIWATAKGPKSNKNPKIVTKRLQNPEFGRKNRVLKFAKTDEGLRRFHAGMLSQVAKDMAGSGTRADRAACAHLMLTQGTRPGGSESEREYQHHWGKELTKQDVVVKKRINKQTGKRVVSKGVPQNDVYIKVPNTKTGEPELFRLNKKETAEEIQRRIKAKEPLHDSEYWTRPFGATTLQGRHIIKAKDGVYLRFIGKELVYNNHKVEDLKFAEQLLKRKAAAGDDGDIFPMVKGKMGNYARTLDGGLYSPKDFRTMRGTQEALNMADTVKRPKTFEDFKKARMKVGELASPKLGNTPTVFLAKYGSPAVFGHWIAAMPKEERNKVEQWLETQESK